MFQIFIQNNKTIYLNEKIYILLVNKLIITHFRALHFIVIYVFNHK